MPLNPSGPISLSGSTAGVSIAAELGIGPSTTISLLDSNVRTLAGVPSGAVTMPTNFYGKSNEFAFSITSNQSNVNLRTAAIAAGWNQSSKVVCTINAGVTVFSTSTGSYALTISGSFPGGVQLNNNGTILGRGGDGATLNFNWFDSGQYYKGKNGNAGGPALLVQTAVSINNAGRISGGGGGGGTANASGGNLRTGQGFYPKGQAYPIVSDSFGGGGGGGIGNGSGGGAAYNPNTGRTGEILGGAGEYPGDGTGGRNGQAGQAGTLTAGGAGGVLGYRWDMGYGANYFIASGAGGSYASTGGTGGQGNIGFVPGGNAPGTGGSGGAAVVGNSNITWIATGTRNGSIS